MRFEIVMDVPRPRRGAVLRLRQFARSVFGLTLMLVAVLSTFGIPYFFLYPVMRSALRLTTPDSWLFPADVPGSIFPALSAGAAAVLCVMASLFFLEYRRNLVLFLRRFGHRGSTETVSAAARRVGRRWRLVTLDDAIISPLDAGIIARGAADATRFGAAFKSAVGKVRAVARRPLARPLDLVARKGWVRKFVKVWKSSVGISVCLVVLSYVIPIIQHMNLDAWRLLFQGAWKLPEVLFVAGLSGLGLTLLPLFIFVILPLSVVFPFVWPALVVSAIVESMAGAHERRAAELSDADSIKSNAESLAKHRDSFLGPRLAVFKVDSSIWRLAVIELGSVATRVLIDVSAPTENILWEIENLTSGHPSHCIFVGEHGELLRLQSDSLIDPLESRLVEHLSGATVVAYTTDQRGRRRFTRALRRRLTILDLADVPATRERA